MAVLNPGGRDPDQVFPDFAGVPAAGQPPIRDGGSTVTDRRYSPTVTDGGDGSTVIDRRYSGAHPPVNYHAYAACTGGGFYRSAAAIPGDCRSVIILLRRDLRPAAAALRALRRRGAAVAIAWKETGRHQIAEHLADPRHLAQFRELCRAADAALASTPDAVEVYRAAGARAVEFIPTPYPADDARWDFGRPVAARRGVMIGTRDWDVPSRNHAAALLIATGFGQPITVVNFDGRRGRRRIAAVGAADSAPVTIVEERFAYRDYLRLLAGHRLVFQFDRSGVPGQVAGDALLCGVPCVGGDGAIDRILLPDGADPRALLADDAYYLATVAAIRCRAAEQLSFAVVARRLAAFFGGL